jgi:hypothetical protein
MWHNGWKSEEWNNKRQPQVDQISPNIHSCEAVSTRNFFAPLRTADMDTEPTEAEQEAPRNSGGPPATTPIRLQSDLKQHVKGEYDFRNTRNGTRIITK